MPSGYLVGEDFLKDIRYAVGVTKDSALRSRIPSIPVRLEGDDDTATNGIRFGQFTGSWLKGATKTVTRLKGDGTAVSPQETFEAKNYFCDLSVDCGTKKVMCARVGETWILIQAEC